MTLLGIRKLWEPMRCKMGTCCIKSSILSDRKSVAEEPSNRESIEDGCELLTIKERTGLPSRLSFHRLRSMMTSMTSMYSMWLSCKLMVRRVGKSNNVYFGNLVNKLPSRFIRPINCKVLIDGGRDLMLVLTS